jgi:enhancer of polycomb-like protein
VPDSTGVVDDYPELYPPDRWKDPATYIRSSETADECCTSALANGFTYYMDERDKEWLDKNNEEARGEGTSAQGALSASGATTRSGPSRSAKAKGKEPDVIQPISISEDDFELVMGLFEKVTHEKTEYLHHVGVIPRLYATIIDYRHQSLETGMAFPAFSEYQDTFSSPLTPTTFAAYTVPSSIPSPAQLLRIARVVYPHWKERRIERGGLRIIPTLNVSKTLNFLPRVFTDILDRATRQTHRTNLTSVSGGVKSRLSARLVPRRSHFQTSSFGCSLSWRPRWNWPNRFSTVKR